jgi:hypothetical protein
MGHSNGSIFVSGSRRRARSQFASNFLPMEAGPFKHQTESACRKRPPHVSRLDLNRDLVLTVDRMEVRGPMFIEEHADDDAEKP